MTAQQIACPHCRNLLLHDAGRAGQVAGCPYCGGQFVMPAAQTPGPAQPWTGQPAAQQPVAQAVDSQAAAQRPLPGPASEFALSHRRRSSRALVLALILGLLFVGVAAALVLVFHTVSPSSRIVGTWKLKRVEGDILFLNTDQLELTFRPGGVGTAEGPFGKDAVKYRVDPSKDPPRLVIWETFLSSPDHEDVFQLTFPDNGKMHLSRQVRVPSLTPGNPPATRQSTLIFHRVD